jgi:hypothetical protein
VYLIGWRHEQDHAVLIYCEGRWLEAPPNARRPTHSRLAYGHSEMMQSDLGCTHSPWSAFTIARSH